MEFDKHLKELEALVNQMAGGGMSLKDTLDSFKKGMDLIKKCQKDLQSAEQLVEKLIQVHDDGRVETEPFENS